MKRFLAAGPGAKVEGRAHQQGGDQRLGLGKFPADPVDLKIVEGIVSLAHGLNLAVTVEGVETGAQAEQLRILGCDTAQGWYYARPGPPERLHELALVDATG